MSDNSIPAKGQTRTLPVLLRNQPISQTLCLALFADNTVTIANSNAPANAFVIEVEDGRFGFPVGTHLVVVKTSKPRHGSLVAVYRHQTGIIVFCRYTKVGDIPLLCNLANHFPLPAEPEDIIGEVIEAHHHGQRLAVK